MTAEADLLASIDTKLSALLALALDDYVRTHDIKGARPKGIEHLLADAGVSTADIAVLLGKTQRAVQLALEPAKTAKPRGSRKR